jgi:hypothetical protein
MTEQSVEAIQLKLKDQRVRSVMQALKIDRQAFRDAIQTDLLVTPFPVKRSQRCVIFSKQISVVILQQKPI